MRWPMRKNVARALARRSSARATCVKGPGPSSNVRATLRPRCPAQKMGTPRRARRRRTARRRVSAAARRDRSGDPGAGVEAGAIIERKVARAAEGGEEATDPPPHPAARTSATRRSPGRDRMHGPPYTPHCPRADATDPPPADPPAHPRAPPRHRRGGGIVRDGHRRAARAGRAARDPPDADRRPVRAPVRRAGEPRVPARRRAAPGAADRAHLGRPGPVGVRLPRRPLLPAGGGDRRARSRRSPAPRGARVAGQGARAARGHGSHRAPPGPVRGASGRLPRRPRARA